MQSDKNVSCCHNLDLNINQKNNSSDKIIELFANLINKSIPCLQKEYKKKVGYYRSAFLYKKDKFIINSFQNLIGSILRSFCFINVEK